MVLKHVVVNYNNKYYNNHKHYSKTNYTFEKKVVFPGLELYQFRSSVTQPVCHHICIRDARNY